MKKRYMRIGIDCRFAIGPATGVTNYVINLLKNLARINSQDEYILYIHCEDKNNRIPNHPRFRKKIIKAPALLWKNFLLPIDVKKERIDVFHSPAYSIPITPIGKTIVTIHDVIHMVNPEWFTRRELFLIKYPFKLSAERATKIIAVSENTKLDIMRFYGVPEDKIGVTLEAANGIYQPIKDEGKLDLIRRKYSIDGKFILYVGVLFKRRNIPRLVKAFAALKKNGQIEHKLVIVGLDKGHFDLEALINEFGLKGDIIYTGHVPTKDMPLLYNAADIFVYPSLCEGFGLPCLESMACGTPVITSNISSMPELVGDAAIMIDPYKIEEIKEAILRLSKDEKLRQNLSLKGLEQVRKFSWRKMAEQTINIYREVFAAN